MAIVIDELDGCHEKEGDGGERADSWQEEKGLGSWLKKKGSRPAAVGRTSKWRGERR
jgi:hypothetical protein